MQRCKILLDDDMQSWFTKSLTVDVSRGTRGGITQQYILHELVQNCRNVRKEIKEIVFPVQVQGQGDDGYARMVRMEDIDMKDYDILYFE